MAADVVVTTMLVVMMMAVAMRVAMTVGVMMIVRHMALRSMIMRLMIGVRVTVGGISAALWIERRFDFDHPRAQSLDHRFDDMVAPNPQTPSGDLRRHMAIAEVPGEANQVLCVATANFQKRLRRRNHLDQTAIFQHQRVATAQGDRTLEVEQKTQPARARHHQPPAVAIVEIEHNRIGGSLRPAMLRLDLRGADHSQAL